MKIKGLLAVLAVFALMSVPAQAQDETRHEIALSYGALSNTIWVDAYSNVISSMFGVSYDKSNYVGPFGLEYYYHITPLFGIGSVFTYASFTQDAIMNDHVSWKDKNSYISILPSVKFNWLRREHWGLYSKVAAGVTLSHCKTDHLGEKPNETENEVMFNFHASAIGVEGGSDHIRGFAELGIGEQGIALAGVRFKF